MPSFAAVPYGETCLSKGGIPVKKKLLSILLVPTMLAAALTACNIGNIIASHLVDAVSDLKETVQVV